MTSMAHTDDSSPTATPINIVVASPVRVAAAISLTGPRLMEVKCSVRREMNTESTRPKHVAQKTRRSPT